MHRWVVRLFALLVTLLVATAAAPVAEASARVDITELVMPPDSGAKLEKTVRTLLHKAARPLDFGSGKRVEVVVKLTELSVEESGDLIRVTCTMVGRLKGGGSARSHISFGGKPKRRKELERQVLSMVSEGVMSRLAEMARAKDALDKKKDRQRGSDHGKSKDGHGKAPAARVSR
jgi:hypothetical protein